MNPALPQHAVDLLIEHGNAALLQDALAASHPTLPDDLRHRLTWDPDAGVAKLLADHPALDADDLRLLAARHGPRLYSAIARNPNAPLKLLHTMAATAPPCPKHYAKSPDTPPPNRAP